MSLSGDSFSEAWIPRFDPRFGHLALKVRETI